MGHRNLLWLGTQSEDETPSATVRREHAFIECVWKMGLHGASCRIPELAKSSHKDQWLKAICTGLRRQLESTAQNPPTAIICFNETMAAGAMQCLTAMGLKVPENMSLAAFDNHLAPMLNPPLTTIDPGLSALGTRCFELAIKMLENPGVIEEMRHHREILPFKLVVRQSTAPAPSGLPNLSL
ncbi:MAG: LacI family transcriptional regulator [Phycisphaerales bacterium]|nr:LacI family transcriptional regulator [Phycisphaerales bacterium]